VLGLTNVKLTIYNVDDPLSNAEIELLVDTGSVLTWISRKTLERLRVKPRRKGRFKTIEGKLIGRSVGIIGVKYGGEETIVEAVFAIDRDAQVLGVTALESLGYRVNPISGKLEYIGLLAI
jgi:predicted aspartyl protease